jgi:sporulation protein YlmC with PRC-barrel domain
MARTPVVARASELIGTEVLDVSSRGVGHVEDLLLRADGRLVVVVEREDGRLVGLQLSELVARAKLDRQRGGDVATIRSFRMAPTSRRLGAAPEIEDKARLDAEWWRRLDAYGVVKRSASDASGAQEAPPRPDDGAAVATDAIATHLVLKQLLGRDAVDDADRSIGTIKDIVVHMPDARVAYVLVTPAIADETAVTRAVPFEAVRGPRGQDGPVLVALDAAALERSPPVADLDRLPVAPLPELHGKGTLPAPDGGASAAPK